MCRKHLVKRTLVHLLLRTHQTDQGQLFPVEINACTVGDHWPRFDEQGCCSSRQVVQQGIAASIERMNYGLSILSAYFARRRSECMPITVANLNRARPQHTAVDRTDENTWQLLVPPPPEILVPRLHLVETFETEPQAADRSHGKGSNTQARMDAGHVTSHRFEDRTPHFRFDKGGMETETCPGVDEVPKLFGSIASASQIGHAHEVTR
tara:strand:- start:10175 stop:10801 length:627 start_codon:yes stop_codon:yes gene_type:complete